jgi:hypothetical protein
VETRQTPCVDTSQLLDDLYEINIYSIQLQVCTPGYPPEQRPWLDGTNKKKTPIIAHHACQEPFESRF